jgi:hypothetical protein
MFTIYSKDELKVHIKSIKGVQTKALEAWDKGENIVSLIYLLPEGEIKVQHFILLEDGVYTDDKIALLFLSKNNKVSCQDLLDVLSGKVKLEDICSVGSVEEELDHMMCVIDKKNQESHIRIGDAGRDNFIRNSFRALDVYDAIGNGIEELEKYQKQREIEKICNSIWDYCVQKGIYVDSGDEPVRIAYADGELKAYPVSTYKIKDDAIDNLFHDLEDYNHGVYLYCVTTMPFLSVRLAKYYFKVGGLGCK